VGASRAVLSRNGVVTSGVPRVTAAEPPDSEQSAAAGAMDTDRTDRVFATTRIKPAAWAEQRADEPAVTADRQEQPASDHSGRPRWPAAHVGLRVTRVSAASRSVPSSADDDPAAGGSTRTTSREPAGRVGNRSATRCCSCRRTRLRTTAPPTLRPTTNPARTDWSAPGSGSARWTTSRPRPARRPRRIAAVKSGRRRSRDAAGSTGRSGSGDVRPRGPDGPSAGGRRGWPGPRGCAYAAGSRALWHGGGCSAGTCACSLEGSRERVDTAMKHIQDR